MTDMPIPSAEQEARAKWDLLLLDIEHRTEQLRQLKTVDLTLKGYEGKRLIIQALVAAGTLLAAGGVVGGLIVRLLGEHG